MLVAWTSTQRTPLGPALPPSLVLVEPAVGIPSTLGIDPDQLAGVRQLEVALLGQLARCRHVVDEPCEADHGGCFAGGLVEFGDRCERDRPQPPASHERGRHVRHGRPEDLVALLTAAGVEVLDPATDGSIVVEIDAIGLHPPEERLAQPVPHRPCRTPDPRDTPPADGTSVGETRASAGRACNTGATELADDLTVDEALLRAFCREHGIRSLRLFGSAARNELRDDSDVDLLVEFEPGRTPGLLGVAKLELELQELVGREVDLRTVGDLSPFFRDDVVAAARVLYDAA